MPMNLSLSINTGLMRRLTAHRVLPVRVLIGSAAGLGALIFTMRPVLMGEIWRRVVYQQDIKLAMRRLAWYGRKCPLRIEVVGDPSFNFTEGLSRHELDAVRSFVGNRTQSMIDRLLDQLTLTAAEVSGQMGPMAWQDILRRFTDDANALFHILSSAAPIMPVHHKSPERERVFSRSMARQALTDFSGLFPVSDLPWYVISGTFLGLVREGGFLNHDHDIDLGVHAENVNLNTVIDRIGKSGDFHIRKIDILKTIEPRRDGGCDLKSTPIMVKLTHRCGVFMDLFLHHLENDIRWHGSSVHRWENSEFDLVSYDLEGIPVLGPSDADRYLTENYGDWRTPVTEFHCSTGTPNVQVVRNLSSIAIFLRRLAVCRLSGDASADRLEAVLQGSGYIEHRPDGLRFSTGNLISGNRYDKPGHHGLIPETDENCTDLRHV